MKRRVDKLEKKSLLSVDWGFGIWSDFGLGDKFVCSLAITSLFAIVQDVDVEPAGLGSEREMGREERRLHFIAIPGDLVRVCGKWRLLRTRC
jgi:hypothetical protein